MKKVAFSLVVILSVSLVTLFILGKEVREIKTEVYLSSTPEQVWKVLTNFNDWKSWNPTITLAEGKPSIGTKLNITINGSGKGDSNYQPIVLASSAPFLFRWRAKMVANFVFQNDRVFELTSKDGGTLLIHKEEFSGLMVPMMWNMFQEFVGPTLEKMNESLKLKLENKKGA
jgi:hypothetical protein